MPAIAGAVAGLPRRASSGCTTQSPSADNTATWPLPKGRADPIRRWRSSRPRSTVATPTGLPARRDIKLENVMLCAEDPHAVKLVDFGLAMPMPKKADGSFDAKVHFHDRVGSKSYRAPEILTANGYEGPPVDVWALGITVFSLVSDCRHTG